MKDIFTSDREFYEKKLAFHKTLGTFFSIISLGLASNKDNIDKYSSLYQKSKSESDKYHSLCKESESIGSESESIILNGVRISNNTFSDIPVINAATYGIDWDVLRLTILDRDGYKCSESDGYCGGPLQIHHIIPLSKGGVNHASNLTTVCYNHHAAKHKHMRKM